MNNTNNFYAEPANTSFNVQEMASGIDTFDVFGDISDPLSAWYDMRVAEMAGFDYLFVPEELGDQLQSRETVEDFLLQSQTLLGAEPERTTILTYTAGKKTSFKRYNAEWAGSYIVDLSVASLENSAQLEFIQMLFEHSEKLVLSIE